ncbi:hypothetical protein [Nubsella zeaxanthinifaciens]|nr:hypothetical protein [Nubsella zeaxanthinifaciens]
MEEAFIEHLDQLYWQGYGETLKEGDQQTYYTQFIEFSTNHELPI